MINSDSPIGVFDSGLGGITVLGELQRLMPSEDFIYLGDSKNAPYGTKTEDEVMMHTKNCINTLLQRNVKAVVIACNTATSVAANELRREFDIPIIGIEPAVKPAALKYEGKTIIVMATPMTLKKEKFLRLMGNYEKDAEIIPLPCPNLVEIIEKGIISGKEIDEYIENLFKPFKEKKISAVVLGCTHYPFIKEALKKYFNYSVDIIDGGYGTAKETLRRLKEDKLINTSQSFGKIEFINSKNDDDEIKLMNKMFLHIKKALNN